MFYPLLNFDFDFDPQPSTFNPQPSTLNLQPSTFNPQPSTLNPLNYSLSAFHTNGQNHNSDTPSRRRSA